MKYNTTIKKIEEFYIQAFLILLIKFFVHWIFSVYFIEMISIHVDTNLWRRASLYGLFFITLTLLTSKESRNKVSHFFNSSCALSLYFLINIFRLNNIAALFIGIFAITLFILHGKGIFGFKRSVHEKNSPLDYWLVVFNDSKLMLCSLILIICSILMFLNLPGIKINEDAFNDFHNYRISRIIDNSEYTHENKEKALEKLSVKEWEDSLHKPKKIEVLQTIANIEFNMLGVRRNIVVQEGYYGTALGVAYYHKNIIWIRLDDLNAIECVKTLLHEVYHFYQFEIIKSLNNIPVEFHDLLYYRDGLNYKSGFENYKFAGSSMNEYIEYSEQLIEINANKFANKQLKTYWKYFNVEEILEDDSEE